jgi:hypothetical protein
VYSCSPQAGLSWKCKDDGDTQISGLVVQVLLEKATLVAHWLACAGSVKMMMIMMT